MIVGPAPFPSWGVDTIQTLDAVRCVALRSEGAAFAVRYLGSLTAAERDTILASGLWLSVVTYGRTSWDGLGAAMGSADGAADCLHLSSAGIPKGATVWIDLEGAPSGAAAALTDWLNARSAAIKAAGYDCGLYVGAGAGLTVEQLYALPHIDRYWRSLSRVDEPQCGWSLLQAFPGDQMLAGTEVDIDYVQSDWDGRFAMMVRP